MMDVARDVEVRAPDSGGGVESTSDLGSGKLPTDGLIRSLRAELDELQDASSSAILPHHYRALVRALNALRNERRLRGGVAAIRRPKAEVLARVLGEPARSLVGYERRIYRAALVESDPSCRYCRTPLTERSATLDHLIPESKGGRLAPENVVVCCSTCNSAKADRTPEEWSADILTAAAKGGAL